MARFFFSNIGVEIGIQKIQGSLCDRFDFPVAEGYWVYFKLHESKEALPLVDHNLKIQVYKNYSEALLNAALRLIETR